MANSLSVEQNSKVANGFIQEEPNIADIKESANISGTLLNKLGTSIPTPFARLHLFNSAFKEVNANSSAYTSEVGENYQKLVSLALDMFEFVYLYGASSEFKILRWNVNQQTEALKKSPKAGHKELGEALEAAWNDAGYNGKELYLFSFGSDIIGGTSPLSVFYTNPNLTKTYKGLDSKHNLFDVNNPYPLSMRSKELRLYLYKLYKTYDMGFHSTQIGQYISNQLNIDRIEDADIRMAMDTFESMDTEGMKEALSSGLNGSQVYKKLESLEGPIVPCKDMELWVKDLSNINFRSKYKIRPTVMTFANYSVNGKDYIMRPPLVLNKYGINGAKYIDDAEWMSTTLPESDTLIPIYDRKLPGTEIRYPYLRAEDFFQEKIIELSYNIYKDKFYTGLDEDTKFLLPLKREFFKYFRPEDLSQMFKLEATVNPEGKVEKVKVTLNVPLEGGNSIPLEKEYTLKDNTIFNAKLQANTFNMAFFPFFKDKAVNASNEFDIMLVSSIDNVALSFYKNDNPEEAFSLLEKKESGIFGEIQKNVRSVKGGNNTVKTTHYHVNKPFDVVEVSIGAESGSIAALILPKMEEKDTTNLTCEFVFGVDFGTTNTQVAFSCNNGPIESFYISLDAEKEELQTVYLNNHKIKDGKHLVDAGLGTFADIASMARREFVTSEMPESFFPIRTAICEVSNLDSVQHPRLFGDLNIGFNYTKEMTTGTGSNRYVTELKWDTKDRHKKDRMKLFFKELLIIMRNKAILNKGRRDISVAVTYPQAMNGRVEEDFKTAWKQAAEELGLNVSNIKFHYESIAPYYSFSRQESINDTYVNIDIGGGSTDILYLNPKTHEKLTFSVMFAGNDIWGDGCNPYLEGGRNGFIRHYESSLIYKDLSEGLKNDYLAVKDNSAQGNGLGASQNSSDIINYLFKNDSDYRFSEEVKDSNMMLVPILHFTSLIYYLAHIAESQDLSMPKILSFTGMGSLYIKLLGNADKLGHLASAIIDYKTQKPGSNIEIRFAPNPKKVTAEGAVTISLAHKRKIELIKTESGLCYGIVEEDPDTRLNIGHIKEGHIKGEPLTELVLDNYNDICEMILKDERYRDILIDMGFEDVINALPDRDKMQGILKESFNICVNNYKRDNIRGNENTNKKVTESLFFWPLKNGLYQLGQYIAGIKKNNE